MSVSDFITWALTRLGLRALRQALVHLPPADRMDVLYDVQTRTLKSMGETDSAALRSYAAKTMERCLSRVSGREQAQIVTLAGRRALGCIDKKHVFEACASLTNMAQAHPRMVDPASFNVDANDPRPVVVGPWLMEIGFELLYWIPYLRAQLARLGIPKERVIAVSRGGAEGWYGDIAGRYLDILDVMTPQEFHDWTSGHEEGGDLLEGNRKPFTAGPFETAILDRVLKPQGINAYQFIMPSAMYGLFRNIWRSRLGSRWIERHLMAALLARPAPFELPFAGPYVAVKFYNSLSFPKTPQLDALARRVVGRLARKGNVVILSNAAQLDDHDTLSLGGCEGQFQVFDASSLYTPRDNLAVQTALVAHASELHCTYGGFSYLGPLLGVDTVAYGAAYTATFKFIFTHLDLAWTTFDAIGGGQLAMLPVGREPSWLPDQEVGPNLRSREEEQRSQHAHSV